MKLLARLTPGRLKWLRHLREVGVGERRGPGRVGYDCMQLGWTAWVRMDRATGRRLPQAEAIDFSDGPVDLVGEELTEEGRRILEMAEGGGA